jgi:hypothetical protein
MKSLVRRMSAAGGRRRSNDDVPSGLFVRVALQYIIVSL